MQTKRDVLLEICEAPGWQPPQPVPSSIDRHLRELQSDGWIHPRLDGWEATHVALDRYPDFEGDPEVHSPGGAPKPSNGSQPSAQTVSLDRVTVFILALMGELPLPRLQVCATATRAQLGVGRDRPLNEIARAIAETLR